MALLSLSDRSRLGAYLTKNRELHLYELGDLDDFFFPRTRWFGWMLDDLLEALCLVYDGGSFGSTLLAFAEPHQEVAMRSLLGALAPTLPRTFYTHLTPGLADGLMPRFELEGGGAALKMALREPRWPAAARDVVWITSRDLEALQALYQSAYPDNWFDARMLETGYYCGIRDAERWLAVAGVHVVSREHKVAALGNIVTAQSLRGRGLGRAVTSALCQKLRRDGIEVIGLNVMRDNAAAIACYRRLGFEVIAEYEELEARAR
jgi:ribosomal protein S18 acetylase RimI-like enzyme